MVAVFERGLIAPPLGEQRGESERACRYGEQRRSAACTRSQDVCSDHPSGRCRT
jgi:hypothetical protein